MRNCRLLPSRPCSTIPDCFILATFLLVEDETEQSLTVQQLAKFAKVQTMDIQLKFCRTRDMRRAAKSGGLQDPKMMSEH